MTANATDMTATAAQRLRTAMTAVRVSIQWLGVRKTLTPQQREQAAEPFGAEGHYLSAGKKLLDTGHPAFRAVTAVRNQILGYWRAMSLPYPEPGIRLIRQDQVEQFNSELTYHREALHEAVEALDRQFAFLKSAARQRLGRLYNEADYPESLQGMFDVEWDFPSVEPPEHLRELSSEIWEQECARVAARFDEAVRLAEGAFIEELGELVSHISERLTESADDSKPKIFRDSAVTKLHEFFQRFRTLNVRSSEQLEQLVDSAQQAIRGISPQELRESQPLRQRIAAQMSAVKEALDGMLVDRPRRRIVRNGTHAREEVA